MQPIPFLDLPKQHQGLLPKLLPTLQEMISGAKFIGGKAVADFEVAFAKFCGIDGCVGVANGTDALMLALRAVGVQRGDTVLVPAHTFIATAEAVNMMGAVPRFVDVDEMTYTLSPSALEKVNGSGVKAVMPVHLYGQPADMQEILAVAQQRGWHVIEDAAQAHGAKYQGRSVGSFGALTGFSFYPGKNLGALGDGGAVVAKDAALLDKVRRLADHGRLTKYEHAEPGINSRLDALQAAALTLKLAYLDDWNAARAKVAKLYDQKLRGISGIQLPQVAEGRTHVYHLYVIRCAERDALRDYLEKKNIGVGIHYPIPLHLQPAYRSLGYEKGVFPVAEKVARECLSLPMFPELVEEQVDRVVAEIRAFAKAGS